MSVNQQTQKLNVATNLIAQGQILAKAWSAIQQYNQLYVKSGISFAAGDFDGTALQYADPTTMATLITQLNAFVTWINTSGNGDIFFRDSNGT